MKALRICFFTLTILFFINAGTSSGDEISELRNLINEVEVRHQKQMEKMEDLYNHKINELKEEHSEGLMELKSRIKTLEAKKEGPSVMEGEQGGIAKKVEKLEEEIFYISDRQDTFLSKLEEKVSLNLYTTFAYEDFENTDSVYNGNEIELLLSANMTDRLRAFAEIEFEGVLTNFEGKQLGEFEVDQSWLEYEVNEYFKPRFGLILTPFGRYNMEHFEPFRDLLERPIAMKKVVPTTWTEAAIGFTGNAIPGDYINSKLLKNLSLNYQLFLTNGFTDNINDTGLREARSNHKTDNNNNKAIVGRMGMNFFGDQEIGLSGYTGKYDDKHHINGFNVDWKFVVEPFEIIGEYALFSLEEGLQHGSDVLTVPGKMDGGYFQANYHFWFSFLSDTFLGRRFADPTFTASLRYDFADIDDDNDENTGDNREDRFTIGLNYRPVETWVFRLEYLKNWTDNETLIRGDNDGFIFSVSAAF